LSAILYCSSQEEKDSLLRAALAPLEAPFSDRIGIEESRATMM